MLLFIISNVFSLKKYIKKGEQCFEQSLKMAVPFKAPSNVRNFLRILAIISVLRSIDLPFLLERSSGMTILYELSNTRAPKRAFLLLYDTRQMVTRLSTPCS